MHVGLDERAGLHQRPVDVCLGGEVHDHVHAAAVHAFVCRSDSLRLGDVALHEAVVRLSFVFGQVLADPGVRELVEVHDLRILAVLAEDEADEIRSDEAGAAGDEITHGLNPFECCVRSARAAR